MSVADSFLAHWYFHIPNLVMSALIYTLIGRYLLELVFSSRPDVVILHVFRKVTDPVVKIVRVVTPLIAPNGLVVVFAIAWLMAARLFWFLTCVAAGMRLSPGG